jgi:hypothetical protein
VFFGDKGYGLPEEVAAEHHLPFGRCLLQPLVSGQIFFKKIGLRGRPLVASMDSPDLDSMLFQWRG